MNDNDLLALLLAVSVTTNIATAIGWLTHGTGAGARRAVLAAAGAAATCLALYFTGVAAYR